MMMVVLKGIYGIGKTLNNKEIHRDESNVIHYDMGERVVDLFPDLPQDGNEKYVWKCFISSNGNIILLIGHLNGRYGQFIQQ